MSVEVNTAVWAGVVSLLIQIVQGGFVLAKHFRLHSECCGKKSAVSWDIGTPEDKSSTAEVAGVELKKVLVRSPTPLPLPGGRPGCE